jgi:hypothetical protein
MPKIAERYLRDLIFFGATESSHNMSHDLEDDKNMSQEDDKDMTHILGILTHID